MISIRSYLPVCVAVLLILTGCVPEEATVTPVPVNTPEEGAADTGAADAVEEVNTAEEAEPPEPPNPEILRALSQLADIRDELKQIRNSVEELQFESGLDKRRRQDLYQDVDRRLLEIERNQQAINSRLETGITAGGIPETGAVTVATDEEEWGMISDSPVEGVAEGSETPVTSVLVVESGSLQDPDESPTDTAVPDSDGEPATDSSATVSLDEQNAYDEALGLLKQSRYQDFILAAQQFVTTWPTSQLADDVWYWIAEAHYVNREFQNALSGFRTVVVRYPDSQRVPEALLKTGYIQYDIGAYNKAAEIFRDILARFPAHNVTVSAQTRLRRIENTIQ